MNNRPIFVLPENLLLAPSYDYLEVAFIDLGLEDRETLINGLRAGVALVDLDPAVNGLDQILNYLEANRGVRVVHLISHGSAGKVELGNVALSNENIDHFASALTKIGEQLAPNAEFHIYGCEVASNEVGAAFISTLADLTKTSIAASTNLTGAAALGGDWVLEAKLGDVTAPIAFEATIVDAYAGVLVAPPPNDENFDGASAYLSSTPESSLIIDGWTFTTDAGPTTFYVGDGGALSSSNTDYSLTFNINGESVSTFIIKSTDGSEFKLDGLDVADYGLDSTTVTVSGYRNGTWVTGASQTFSLPSSGVDSLNLSSYSAFANIDQIGLSFDNTNPSFVEIDNLNISTAVVPDTTPPTVSSIIPASGANVAASTTSVNYTVTFSENVSGVDASDFTLTPTGTASGSIASVTQVNASTYTVTVNALSGDGTLRLDLKSSGTGITDTASNLIATGFTSGQTYTLDHYSPPVSGVNSSTSNGTYKVGDVIAIQVAFGEAVNVTGTPQLTLETGSVDRVVNYASGSGTNTLTFNYTVQTGDSSADLDYLSTAALTLNSGTIKDAAGNDATLTLASPGAAGSLAANKAIVIDGVAPEVSGVSSSTANGIYTVGDTIVVTVNFTEAVAVTGTPQLTLETGTTDRTIDYTGGSGTSTLTFGYTVQLGDTSADLDYLSTGSLSLNGGTIRDAAGNNATLTLASPGAAGSLGNNKALVIDTAPTITSATYVASTGVLTVAGTNMAATAGGNNDIDVSKLTLNGQGGNTYTLTTANVEITNSTSFSVTLNSTDQLNVNGLLDKNGTSSVYGTTYNVAGAAGWNVAASAASDTTGNGITVTNVTSPTITSATFDATPGVLTVSGANLVKQVGLTNDISVSSLIITGEGGATCSLTSTDVEIISGSSFSVTLNATDLAFLQPILNKNGTSSTGGTTYNLAAVDDWNTVIGNTDISDATNALTVSNVVAPSITSATYNGAAGVLVVTGIGFTQRSGVANDIVANKFTVTGEAGALYTLTDTANVDIASGTSFTLSLSATDKAAVNLLLNQNGTSSSGATPYNLAAAEDWAAGADTAVLVADLTNNGVTVSNAGDTTAPVVTSVVVPSNGHYRAATNLNFTVNFDESVFVNTGVGTPRIALTIGASTVYADYLSGTGTTALVFRHVVQAGETDTDGITVGALGTNGGTIQDAAGNNATLTLSSVGSTTSVLVDTTAPTNSVATAVFSADTGISATDLITSAAGQTISGTLASSLATGEVVRISLDDGATWTVANATGGSNAWNLTGQTLFGLNTLKVVVSDLAGNNGPMLASPYAIDNTAPTATVTTASVDIGTNVTTAQSTEQGLAFLVSSGATVTNLASLTALVTGGTATQANVTAAATNTTLSTTSLIAGTYKIYTVDEAGNVSVASTNGITLTTPAAGGGGGGDDGGYFPFPDNQYGDLNPLNPNDILTGDRFYSGSADSIDGQLGNDTIIGLAGNDTLNGGSGFDLLRGGQGDDFLQGGTNGDTIFGGQGNDVLRGGSGLDSLDGGVGNDILFGGLGTDILTGGQGNDIFMFTTALDGRINIDTITDFTTGTDRIELSASVFTALAGQVGSNIGLGQHIRYDATTGVLSYIEDASGAKPPVAFAVLGTTSHPASVGTDFWIVA